MMHGTLEVIFVKKLTPDEQFSYNMRVKFFFYFNSFFRLCG